MTRSRDLADLADGDFAGTWTVDGLDVSGTGLVTGVLTTTAQVVQNGGFDSNDASTIIAADGAADNQFALQIQNLESTNDRSYGLYIRAGTTVTDSPLHIYDYTGSTQLFRVTGTGQALFTDGSESLPSITNIGDTNTGIFFPAADTIAFSEGGSEAMRIRSTGDVGIGTGGDFTYDDITGSGFGLAIGSSSASSAGIQIRTGTSGVGRIYFGDNSGSDAGRKKGSIEFDHSTDDLTITAEDDLRLYGGEDVVMRGTTYAFENAAGNTNYLTIDSSGNTTIGGVVKGSNGSNSAPTFSFSNDTDTGMYLSSTGFLALTAGGTKGFELGGGVIYTAANGAIRSNANSGSLTLSGGGATVGGQILLRGGEDGGNEGDIVFKAQKDTTSPTERMRIDASGGVSIGTGANATGIHSSAKVLEISGEMAVI